MTSTSPRHALNFLVSLSLSQDARACKAKNERKKNKKKKETTFAAKGSAIRQARNSLTVDDGFWLADVINNKAIVHRKRERSSLLLESAHHFREGQLLRNGEYWRASENISVEITCAASRDDNCDEWAFIAAERTEFSDRAVLQLCGSMRRAVFPR